MSIRWEKITCQEADCDAWRLGETLHEYEHTDAGRRHAAQLRTWPRRYGLHFREEKWENGATAFVFPPGQNWPCDHVRRIPVRGLVMTGQRGGAVDHRAAAAYLEQLAAAEAAVQAAKEHRDQLAAQRPAGVTREQVAQVLRVSVRGLAKRLAQVSRQPPD